MDANRDTGTIYAALMTELSDAGSGQDRHSVAWWREPVPLRLRFMVLVALGVTILVLSLTWFQVRNLERTIDADLTDTGRLTAQAIADDLELVPLDEPSEIDATLHEFLSAEPALRSISVFTSGAEAVQVSSTQTRASEGARALAQRVLQRQESATSRDGGVLYAGHPVGGRSEPMAVVVSVSLAAVEQARTEGLRTSMALALVDLVMLLLLIDTVTRRFIYKPIANLRTTMRRVAGGDWSARAPILRRDELGAVTAGLNTMVSRLGDFNRDLQERIDEATLQLRRRNEALEQSYQRVLGLREALARAERLAAIGQVAASVAHEVGTPLNLISGYVQVLRDDPAMDLRSRERLGIVDDQIAKVTRVLRSMLDQARRPVVRQPVSLARIVERACEVARPNLERANISLALTLPDDLPPLNGDEVQLELALLTLINNAMDAMPHGGTLEISARPHDHGVRLEVRDTGPGIPPEVLDRIFEPWVTTKPVGRGTGLGLSIVKDVVRAHGGTIEVETRPGAGTLFRIELSSARPEDEPADHSAEGHATHSHR